jgi:hypothetical protein
MQRGRGGVSGQPDLNCVVRPGRLLPSALRGSTNEPMVRAMKIRNCFERFAAVVVATAAFGLIGPFWALTSWVGDKSPGTALAIVLLVGFVALLLDAGVIR